MTPDPSTLRASSGIHLSASERLLLDEYQHDFHRDNPDDNLTSPITPAGAGQGHRPPPPRQAGTVSGGAGRAGDNEFAVALSDTTDAIDVATEIARHLDSACRRVAAVCPPSPFALQVVADAHAFAAFAREIEGRLVRLKENMP